MKYAIFVILLFALLFAAFHPEYITPLTTYAGAGGGENGGVISGGSRLPENYQAPEFSEVWNFGYNVVFGPWEVLASIGDGIDVFVEKLVDWFKALFA